MNLWVLTAQTTLEHFKHRHNTAKSVKLQNICEYVSRKELLQLKNKHLARGELGMEEMLTLLMQLLSSISENSNFQLQRHMLM